MILVIDVREASHPNRTGKGQWTYGLVSELLKRQQPLHLLTNCPLPAEWAGAPNTILPTGWGFHWSVKKCLKKLVQPVLYLSTTSYLTPLLVPKEFAVALVVHDLIAFRPEPHQFKARAIERLTLGKAVRRSKLIVTNTQATKADLLKQLPEVDPAKVATIYAGPMTLSAIERKPDGKTIACIGTLSPRKNQLGLIKAYRKLPSDLRKRFNLVLAGNRGWQDSQIIKLARSTPGVTWQGYASPQDYQRLLSTCEVMALPSLYEGFGMQILDALSLGVPILTSDRGSLKEVAGSAALKVDPESVDSIAEGLKRILTDDSLRAFLQESGPKQAGKFNWPKTVNLLLSAISC